jgi:hypothetical protein
MQRDACRLHLATGVRDDAVVVTATGVLDLAGCQPLRDWLHKAGTEAPRAVLVDITHLRIDRPSLLALFATVHERLAEWPGLPLLLVAGPGRTADLLAAGRTDHYLPVHETVAAALAAAGDPLPRRVARMRLANAAGSAATARRFTDRTCAGWGVGRATTDDALLLVSELVSNATSHTGAEPRVRLELRRGLLSVAVGDDVPGTVSIPDPAGDPSRTHGLLLVAQLARAWGCSPTTDGGKVVWATLRTR